MAQEKVMLHLNIDILREPKYKTRWIKTWNADSPIDTQRIFNEVRQKYKFENPYDEISK